MNINYYRFNEFSMGKVTNFNNLSSSLVTKETYYELTETSRLGVKLR